MKHLNLEKEYLRCAAALIQGGILAPLLKSARPGVIGIDGNEYPMPTLEQVTALFARNQALVDQKAAQGFDRMELVPLALPLSDLVERMREVILKHTADGKIFQTRRSESDPLIPVRINQEKHVWVWETLRLAFENNELVYFPREYFSDHHGGQTKLEVIHNRQICAVPGWSVGLVESLPILPEPGQGQILGGRKQLEIGQSPWEYLELLRGEAYAGETGKTLEDFMIKFITRLEETNEVSHDVEDKNGLWCLGQYLKISYADVVPTGRWIRPLGRSRLDMHRTRNKQCAQSFGAATTVRLGA